MQTGCSLEKIAGTVSKNNRHLTFNCVLQKLHRYKQTANIDFVDFGPFGYVTVAKFSIELFFKLNSTLVEVWRPESLRFSHDTRQVVTCLSHCLTDFFSSVTLKF